MTTPELSLAIQAGGESSRMGQDKGLLPFLGQPLVQHLILRLGAVAQEILVTTNQLQAYRFLNVPLYPDSFSERGALGGLFTALSAAHGRLVAVIACDMPFASPAVLEAQRDRLIAENLDAILPRWDDRLQPFHAVYRRETCLPWVKAALEGGRRRANAWLENVHLATLSPAEILQLDPSGLTFFNINTPAEYHQAEELANKMQKP